MIASVMVTTSPPSSAPPTIPLPLGDTSSACAEGAKALVSPRKVDVASAVSLIVRLRVVVVRMSPPRGGKGSRARQRPLCSVAGSYHGVHGGSAASVLGY